MACTKDCHRPSPAQAHCGACRRTFGGITGFDRHRRHGLCLDPSAFGYAEIRGIWRVPLDDDARSRLLRGWQSAEQAEVVPTCTPTDSVASTALSV